MDYEQHRQTLGSAVTHRPARIALPEIALPEIAETLSMSQKVFGHNHISRIALATGSPATAASARAANKTE